MAESTSQAEDSVAAPKRPHADIDFTRCLKCQCSGGTLVKKPRMDSYERFTNCTRNRAVYGDIDFIPISQRLENISNEDLMCKDASWHMECYKHTTNQTNIDRLKTRYEKALPTGKAPKPASKGRPSTATSVRLPVTPIQEPSDSPYHRSSSIAFNKEKCFFCQGSETKHLHQISSFNAGSQLKNAVELSTNMQWKVQLSATLDPKDAHAYDFKYHLPCWVTYVQRSSSTAQSKDVSNEMGGQYQQSRVSAEIEFYSLLNELIHSGTKLNMGDIHEKYHELMQVHNATEQHRTRRQLKEDIRQHFPDLQFGKSRRANEPEQVYTKETASSAVYDRVEQDAPADMQAIFDCSKLVRKDIVQGQKNAPWTFEGSLNTPHAIPHLLKTLLRWVIIGPASTMRTDARELSLTKTVETIAQNIMYAAKTDRQVVYTPQNEGGTLRHMNENPQVVGLGLAIHNSTRSKTEVDLLHKFGYSVDYQRILRIETQIANAVIKQMNSNHGVYIPLSIQKGRFIYFAMDNSDFSEDTPDGKNTLHATATIVCQQKYSDDQDAMNLQIEATESLDKTLHDASHFTPNLEHCDVTGNPKPKSCHTYEDFKPLQNEHVLVEYHAEDMAWLITKAAVTCTSTQQEPKTSATWSGNNSLIRRQAQPMTTVCALPLLAAPAHEWQTMITVLMQAQQINAVVMGPKRKTVITFDMALYEKARRLELLQPEFKDKFIFRIGEFHTVLCVLRAIGSSIENSGIDDAWIASDIYGPNTVRQILEGRHMKRAINAHITTLLVFFNLYFAAFVKENPQFSDSCAQHIEITTAASTAAVNTAESIPEFIENHDKLLAAMQNYGLAQQINDFDQKNESPSFKVARSYMESIMSLLLFIRASRQGHWDLHLASLENLCPIIFARDRIKYAQMVPGYIAQMYGLKDSDPEIWLEFEKGNFCVNKTEVPFCGIGVDHAIEHVNRMMKVKGGITGITQKPAALARFFLAAPELSRLTEQVYEMANTSLRTRSKHHELSAAVIKRQMSDVKKLQSVVEECNPFSQESDLLVNIVTRAVMPDNIKQDILRTDEAGKQGYIDFVEKRVVGSASFWDKMTKMKLLTWKSASKTVKIKLASHEIELKQDRSLFARLLIVTRSRSDVNLQESIGMYEFTCIPRSLFSPDGSILACLDKSKLMAILEASPQSQQDFPDTNMHQDLDEQHASATSKTLVIDGMAVVHELSVLSPKTCSEFADKFTRAIAKRSTNYSSVHVVFDRYDVPQSLKQQTRHLRYGKDNAAHEYEVADSTKIKVPLKKFLSSNRTKDSLTVYLAKKTLAHFEQGIPLVVSSRNGVQSTHFDVDHLSSNHEEADILLILHALFASQQGKIVHIMSPDTDVFVLAVSRQPQLGDNACMIVGTGDKRRTVLLKPIHEAIGQDIAEGLPGFHALTGSDTTGRFAGKGKITCWNTLLKSSQQVIDSIKSLGRVDTPSQNMYDALEEYVCLLYSPRSNITDIAKLRWHLFKKKQAEAEKLPPTRATLKHHILRAHFQAVIWCNDTMNPVLPSPVDYGWTLENDNYIPVTSESPPAPEAIIELVKCNCGTSRCASSSCSCKKHDLACTEMCACDADDENCSNTNREHIPSEDEDEGDVNDEY